MTNNINGNVIKDFLMNIVNIVKNTTSNIYSHIIKIIDKIKLSINFNFELEINTSDSLS